MTRVFDPTLAGMELPPPPEDLGAEPPVDEDLIGDPLDTIRDADELARRTSLALTVAALQDKEQVAAIDAGLETLYRIGGRQLSLEAQMRLRALMQKMSIDQLLTLLKVAPEQAGLSVKTDKGPTGSQFSLVINMPAAGPQPAVAAVVENVAQPSSSAISIPTFRGQAPAEENQSNGRP